MATYVNSPHRDGGVGAVRVEIRGRLENHRVTKVIGAVSSPSTATAIVTEVLCEMFVKKELNNQSEELLQYAIQLFCNK